MGRPSVAAWCWCLLLAAQATAFCSRGTVLSTRPHSSSGVAARRRLGVLLKTATDDDAATEAIAIFRRKFREARPGSMFDLSETELRATFATLETLYGAEAALEMTRRTPASLAFDSKNFEPTFKIWTEIFGEAETRGMVLRNPALLGVPPTGYNAADSAGPETMAVSYLVAFTRPAGPFLLAILFLFLATPIVEGLSGTPIRALLFDALFTSSSSS